MAFIKRLGYYLVGLSIGIVFLTLILKNKSKETDTEFCYFPNCRVLKDLRKKPISFSNEMQKMMKDQQLDTVDISKFLKNGEVDFGQSTTRSTPCKTYIVNGELKGRPSTLKFKNCNASVVLEGMIE